ncbi:DUF350 domain-containing protein [Pseudomonas sp. NPDC090202]|uniref:DUF350 domain-containing protein n=1 Tax=unclassified Pseudomonas TaxID=196821 RepID=UPI00382539A7
MIDALKMSLQGYAVLGFVLYLIGAVAIFSLFAFVYTRLTPHAEFALIREGNTAASVALAGALIGFAIPVASVISHSISLLDFLVWALIASLVQLLVFGGVSLVVKGLSKRIDNGEMASAVLVAAISVSIGLLNAACMTPPV